MLNFIKHIKNYLLSSIGVAAILTFLGLSIVSTLFFSFLDYERELVNKTTLLERELNQIQKGHVDSLSESMWKMDYDQVNLIVSSLLNTDDIEMVRLYEKDVLLLSKGVEVRKTDQIKRKYQLNKVTKGKTHFLGTLEIIATKKLIKDLLRSELKIYILTEFFKIIIFVIFSFVFIRIIIIRHVNTMTKFFVSKNLYDDNNRLVLNRDLEVWKTRDDNFDILVKSINKMLDRLQGEFQGRLSTQKKLIELNEDLERRVDLRTRDLLDSHRIGAVAEMSSGFMHEINSPLSVIHSVSKRLYRLAGSGKPIENSKIDDLVQLLENATNRIFVITGALDLLSEVNHKEQVELVYPEVFIPDCKKSIIEIFKPLITNLSFENENCNQVIETNKALLIQLVFIIVHLRSKQLHSQTESELKIKFSQDEKFVFIDIEDNGPRISDLEFSFLKNPFKNETSKASGSLLMWGTVSAIISGLNGSVNLSDYNNGVRLKISIPLRRTNNESA